MMRDFAEYLLRFASTSWGPVVMVIHAFLESFILPVAHEFFLIPVALAHPHLSFVYALMSTVASTLGIAVGYGIGKWGGRHLILRFIKPEMFLLAKKEIHKYDVWAIAIASFTPFPDKVMGPVAGALHVNFKKMMITAFLARGCRFFLVSGLLYFYGEPVRDWVLDYMDRVMIILVVVMIASFFSWKWLEKYLIRKEHIRLQ